MASYLILNNVNGGVTDAILTGSITARPILGQPDLFLVEGWDDNGNWFEAAVKQGTQVTVRPVQRTFIIDEGAPVE